MRPTTADDNVFDFNALLHPGTVFEHPKDVVRHSGLTAGEKRAILASWASDASAIAMHIVAMSPQASQILFDHHRFSPLVPSFMQRSHVRLIATDRAFRREGYEDRRPIRTRPLGFRRLRPASSVRQKSASMSPRRIRPEQSMPLGLSPPQ